MISLLVRRLLSSHHAKSQFQLDVTSITVENPTFRLEIGALCARAKVQAVPQGIEIFE